MKLKLILTALVAMIVLSLAVTAGSVAINPATPTDADNLNCDVTSSSATYNYYWYNNGALYSTKTAQSSNVISMATAAGDTWKCKAFIPSSAYFPETYVGETTVTIAPSIVIPDAACEDGIDNDGDNLVDMNDPGCTSPNDDNEYNPIYYACSDNIDNDGDGLVDMADPGCTNPEDNNEYNAPPVTACADGIDNDNDGLVDMADPGCASPQDDNEYNYVPQVYQCNDGIDNDNDGFTDMNDPGCTSPQDDNEYNYVPQLSECEDGIDNDGDGNIDYPNDIGCTSTDDDDEYNPSYEYACSDGIDNDNDGLTDYPNDPGCTCPGDDDEYNAPPVTECTDGLDNDADGLIDSNDPGCVHGDTEDDHPQCSDYVDNDNDGMTDTNDPGCEDMFDDDESNDNEPLAQCEDGIDNDNDGLTDMADPGCTSADDDDEYDNSFDDICTIEQVWNNGFELKDNIVEVQLGETMNLDVKLFCNIDEIKELRLKGEIYSRQFEDLETETGLFQVKPGVTYFKSLSITVPEWMDTEDNKLVLKLFDGQDLGKEKYNIYIKETRHNVVISDIMTTDAEAGEPLFIKVRLENQGYEREDDIKVTAELAGTTSSTYVNWLTPFGDEANNKIDGDNVETARLYMILPEDIVSGDHELKITLNYHRGRETLEEVQVIPVAGAGKSLRIVEQTLMDSTNLPKEMQLGQNYEMKVQLVNLNDTTRAYSLEVLGADWADTVLSEQLITVEPGYAGEIKLNVSPKEAGEQQLKVLVYSNGHLVGEYETATTVTNDSEIAGLIILSAVAIMVLVALILVGKSILNRKLEEETYY